MGSLARDPPRTDPWRGWRSVKWRDRLPDRSEIPSLSELDTKTLVLVGVVFGVMVAAAGGAVFQNNVPMSGTVPFQTESGVAVHVSGASDFNGTEFRSDTEVYIATGQGDASFSGTGSASADVDASNLTGTWTNVTNLDVSTNELTINPEDKARASVSGNADSFAFRKDVSVTDSKPDFVYAGTTGTTTVTVRGVAPGVRIVATDSTGTILGSGTSSSTGVVTLSGMANSEHVVTLSAESGPYVKTADPTDDTYLDYRNVDLNATVVDPEGDDFESVEIQTYGSGTWTTVATETGLPSGNEINASISAHPGRNTWRVIMNATGNRDKVSKNFTFRTPGVITIYNGTTDTVASTTTITAGVASISSDYRNSLTTTTGSADLVGIAPPDEILASDWSGSGLENQSLVIRDPSKNGTVVLYETSAASTYTQCFSVSDPTGTFTPGNSWVVVEGYVDGSWKTVGSEQFGVENEANIVIEDGKSYRIRLRNEDGDLRVLGGFTGDSSNNCVPLDVTSSVGDPDDPNTVNHNATCTDTDPKRVKFEYNDTAVVTSTIYYHVYEYQNASNVLVPNTTFTGTFGVFTYTANVPSDQNNTAWVVDAVAVRDGQENLQIERVVCGQRDVLPSMPQWLITFVFTGFIFITAGLFSQLNGAIGGLVVAGLGAMMWFMGLAPGMLGGGVVALSMITAAVLFIRESRGGGF